MIPSCFNLLINAAAFFVSHDGLDVAGELLAIEEFVP
jgi:hypothetical protein